MPRYKITEYRGVNLVGFAASGTSTICADNLENAKLIATCFNSPKGEWNEKDNVHTIGNIEEGNMSIVIPIPDRAEYKNIKDEETRRYCENNLISDDTFKLAIKGYVIRPNPYQWHERNQNQMIFYDQKRKRYFPIIPIKE